MSKTYISKALRERVTQQGRRRCGYCLTQQRVVGTPMEVDHIIPEALDGKTEEENLWLACKLCNDYKGDEIAAVDPRLFPSSIRAINAGASTLAGHRKAIKSSG